LAIDKVTRLLDTREFWTLGAEYDHSGLHRLVSLTKGVKSTFYPRFVPEAKARLSTSILSKPHVLPHLANPEDAHEFFSSINEVATYSTRRAFEIFLGWWNSAERLVECKNIERQDGYRLLKG
jgi:hypothetical protein